MSPRTMTLALAILAHVIVPGGTCQAQCLSRSAAIAQFIGFDLPLVGEPTGTLYYPNGNTARSSGGTWYYQNGNTAVSSGGTWYYQNGNTARSSGGTWYFENGNTAISSGGTWYYQNGNTMRSSGGTWYHQNGNTALSSSGTLYYPNGNTAGHFDKVSASQMVKFLGIAGSEARLLIAAAVLADEAQHGVLARDAGREARFSQLHGI